ncbi:MAG: polymerase subunit gamma/tau [Bacillota bacterium]|jgi:DNA polymerase-3 subunit gamma/tau|nr:polymerase subunit gamma/tau [Bacillota bacterium]MDK2856634.1 polymerase subunit gamma/tau [Bacillota bacterium]MDK2925649.1 polymerase subunit gamma/tau [Bacillota bacterium]
MTYRALYRAWRPQTFDEVMGQEHVSRTLKNAIATDRLAHAYLFCGPRGTGKTSMAKILAKALNCEHGPTPEPCDRCSLCRRIREGYCLDVLEMDAASNRGIDEIRSLRDQVNLAPTEARYKVYIIDEVHMLTAEAFNAFLKTLEEPPPRVVFILATTEPERIPATILSRCQRFDFRRLTPEIIAQRLGQVAGAEGLTVEPRSLALIARAAEGSLRDALGLLDQCISFSGKTIRHADVLELLGAPPGEVLTAIVAALGERNAGRALELLDTLRAQGKDPRLILKDLILWLRNLMLLKVCREPGPLLSLSSEEVAELKEAAAHWSAPRVMAALKELSEEEGALRWTAQPWIVLETALAGLCLGEEGPAASSEMQPEHVPAPAADQLQNPKEGAPQPEARARPNNSFRVSLAQIKAAWPRILEEIKGRSPALEAVWRYGEPSALSNNALTVRFAAEGIKNVAAQPEKLRALEEALQEILKLSLTVRVEAGPAPHPAGAGESRPAETQEPPGVREARALFGPDKVVIRDKTKKE